MRIPRTILTLALALPAAAQTPSNVNVDLLVLYSNTAAALYPGGIDTRIQHMLAVSNQAYSDSTVGITLRLAHKTAVSYGDSANSNTALSAFQQNAAPFTSAESLRTQYGADMAVLLRPYVNDGIAGLAYVGGTGTQGNLSGHKRWMYSHISVNTADYVLAHELGHNFGLAHSRLQTPGGGTWSYSAGYGVAGQFVTIMAYASSFGVNDSSGKLYRFSNPLQTHNGMPIGIVSTNASQGADAAKSLNAVRQQVSDFYASTAFASSRAGQFGGDTLTDLVRHDPDDGQVYLWITGTDSAPASGLGTALQLTTSAGQSLAAAGDFDGDGDSDVLLRANASDNSAWLLDDGTQTAVAYPALAGSTWSVVGTGDFDGDGDDDLLWRNSWTGANTMWRMNGASAPTVATVSPLTNLAWRLGAAGDLNGDGRADLVWRNSSTGANALWLMNGATATSSTGLTAVADLNFRMVGASDFDGDGDDDLVFQHASDGRVVIWLMNGATLSSSYVLSVRSLLTLAGLGDFDGDGRGDDLAWTDSVSQEEYIWTTQGATVLSRVSLTTGKDLCDDVQVAGDLDGDGKADLVWRNAGMGTNRVSFMNGTAVSSASALDTLAGSGFTVLSSGDFDGDGKRDLLWRDSASGAVRVWLMDGATATGKHNLATVADANQRFAVVGDLDGDGKDDVVFRHATTGVNTYWKLNGGAAPVVGTIPLLADTGWTIAAAADMNADGRDDLVWRHLTQGKNAVWYMNGATRTGSANLTVLADVQWRARRRPRHERRRQARPRVAPRNVRQERGVDDERSDGGEQRARDHGGGHALEHRGARRFRRRWQDRPAVVPLRHAGAFGVADERRGDALERHAALKSGPRIPSSHGKTRRPRCAQSPRKLARPTEVPSHAPSFRCSLVPFARRPARARPGALPRGERRPQLQRRRLGERGLLRVPVHRAGELHRDEPRGLHRRDQRDAVARAVVAQRGHEPPARGAFQRQHGRDLGQPVVRRGAVQRSLAHRRPDLLVRVECRRRRTGARRRPDGDARPALLRLDQRRRELGQPVPVQRPPLEVPHLRPMLHGSDRLLHRRHDDQRLHRRDLGQREPEPLRRDLVPDHDRRRRGPEVRHRVLRPRRAAAGLVQLRRLELPVREGPDRALLRRPLRRHRRRLRRLAQP
jgi:hypothetical protein